MLLTRKKFCDMIRASRKGRGTGTVPFLLQIGYEHKKIYQQKKGYYHEKSD